MPLPLCDEPARLVVPLRAHLLPYLPPGVLHAEREELDDVRPAPPPAVLPLELRDGDVAPALLSQLLRDVLRPALERLADADDAHLAHLGADEVGHEELELRGGGMRGGGG